MAMTFEATTMAVYLSLNVEVIDDQRGADFLAVPLLSLAWLAEAYYPTPPTQRGLFGPIGG